MRALALIATLAAACAGCASGAAEPGKQKVDKPTSYNRRDLPPTDGLFSGEDGSFTIYRNEAEREAAAPEAPEAPAEAPDAPEPGAKTDAIPACEPGPGCEPVK